MSFSDRLPNRKSDASARDRRRRASRRRQTALESLEDRTVLSQGNPVAATVDAQMQQLVTQVADSLSQAPELQTASTFIQNELAQSQFMLDSLADEQASATASSGSSFGPLNAVGEGRSGCR